MADIAKVRDDRHMSGIVMDNCHMTILVMDYLYMPDIFMDDCFMSIFLWHKYGHTSLYENQVGSRRNILSRVLLLKSFFLLEITYNFNLIQVAKQQVF